jgi:hypothetical protein
MSCPALKSICIKQGDTIKWRFTLRLKSTGVGIPITGATFRLKINELFANDVVGPNVLDKNSTAHGSYFIVTDLANGVVWIIIPFADTAVLDHLKNYRLELKRTLSGEVYTMLDAKLTIRKSL